MSESRGRITDYRSRPSSEQLVDLHIYIVPPDIWRDKHNDVLNTDVNETISAGFVRVHPENKVFSLRDDIEQQLGVDVLPRDYVFMKCVGRSLTRVKAKQEYQLKVKNFLPPLAYLPEVYLLEITADIRAQFGLSSGEGSSRSQTRTSVRAGESPHHQPTGRGRYPDDRYNNRDRLNYENEKIRKRTNQPGAGKRGEGRPSSALSRSAVGSLRSELRSRSSNRPRHTSDNIQSGKSLMPLGQLDEKGPDSMDSGRDKHSDVPKRPKRDAPIQEALAVHFANPATPHAADTVQKYDNPHATDSPRKYGEDSVLPPISNDMGDQSPPTGALGQTGTPPGHGSGRGSAHSWHSQDPYLPPLSATPPPSSEKGHRANKDYEKRAYPTKEDSGVAEYAPDAAYRENNYDDQNSRRRKDEEDLRRRKKEEQARREEEDRRRRDAEKEALRRRLAADMDDRDDMDEMERQQRLLDEEDRRLADEERWQEENERRRRGEAEEEDRRRRDAEEEEEYQQRRDTAAAEEEQEAKRKQQEENDLRRIEEERRRLQDDELNKHDNDEQTDEELSRFPSPPPLRLSSPDQEDTEEDKRRKKAEKEKLQSDLEKAREERKTVEKQREELVKKAKQLQMKTQNRRNHARDLWKKRYFEEKKKTSPLDEQCNRLRNELDQIHRKLMSTLEGPKDHRGVRLADNKPSEKNNYKIQATRLQHEIEDMRRKVENSKMKLTAEMKLRNQAETELRALRAELTQKKINLTLTRSQQLATLAQTQDLAYMSPRAMATPRS